MSFSAFNFPFKTIFLHDYLKDTLSKDHAYILPLLLINIYIYTHIICLCSFCVNIFALEHLFFFEIQFTLFAC